MELVAGNNLGPYEVLGPIGAGGMGEVYRARDTRLDRCVALKILPAHFSCSPELKSRFEREARTLSSVSHPHICHLYDVGSQSGTDFLVMELLEGETLAARLCKGALPTAEVFKIGMEIADALASAHRLGLVHRDLKPSNIMLTKAGAKLMDFGLAKNVINPMSGISGSSPTISGETLTAMRSPGAPITSVGSIVGTIQYMSPEQLEGREADARSDLFALGAVLYEMATGQRAFEGKSYMSVASAIIHKEPPLVSAVQPTSPAGLGYIISGCLAKDPDERFQTAHDVKLQLGWLAQSSGSSATPAKKDAMPRRWRITWAVVAAGLLIAIGFSLARFAGLRAASAPEALRLTVTLPPRQELGADITMAEAISPDGKRLAYIAVEGGVSRLYTRRLDHFEAVAIPESEGAIFPFFSPKGDWVAFFRQGKLQKAPTDGGVPQVICEIPSFFGGTWTPRDIIVVSVPNLGLATVPAAGGTLQKVPMTLKETVYPQGLTWLAGGNWVVFTDYLSFRRQMMAVNLTSGETRRLLENATSPSYSAGHLLYYQGGAVWAAPFDDDKVQILGSAVQIDSGVNEENYIAQVTASRDNVLIFAPGLPGNSARNLFLVNRQGQEQKLDLPPKDYIDPVLSPDGKRLAVVIRSIQELEVIDRGRGTVTSIAPTLANFAAVWTPDGQSLVFDAIPRATDNSYRMGVSQDRGIFQVAADGGSAPKLLRVTPQISHVTAVAGEYAALMVSDPVTNTDLWLMSLHEPYEMKPFKQTSAVERQGALSPDGRWMAYSSNDSGRTEIYVEPVPGPGGRRQISSEGGDQPRWVRNGREIVYRNGTKMISVPITMQPMFQAGRPVELFDRKFDPGAAVAGYDVSPDGQLFLMTRAEHENPTQIRVVVNWPANLMKQK
jgi:eukaryotic-like serine/threonine-protein kinase